MAEKSEDTGSWDKIEASEGFQEHIGKKHDDPGKLSMPDESLPAADRSSFQEQLPAQDDYDRMTDSKMMDDEPI